MKANIINKNKKNTTMRKIVPAAGMLTISAVMLATSTYAWFTMSREVEVTGIKMTATVPEDIQISLGHLSNVSVNATGKSGLSNNEGTLTPSSQGSLADDGAVQAPAAGNDQTSMLDWSNTIEIGTYYKFGRLIPASSTNGENIYFTPDADGVGKTVKGTAEYYAAANGLTPVADTAVQSGSGTSLAAKLHANVANDSWTATASTAYNVTQDDGYYVDIPIWLRTSSTAGVTLKVDAYVTPDSSTAVANNATDELYKATRIAILPSGTSGDDVDTGSAGLTKLIDLQDAWDSTNSTTVVNPYDLTNKSILNWYNDKKNTSNGTAIEDGAVVASGTLGTDTIYAAATSYKYADGTVIATLPASANGTAYGQMKKYIVRLWLEGEDPECWNANAGQDWAISMKFTKIEAAQSGGNGTGG